MYKRQGLLQLEGDIRGQTDLLIEGRGIVEPLELACAIGVVAIEEAVVIALLNELLNVLAIVYRITLVGDPDICLLYTSRCV